ncbi:hypothetical protein [Streptomyces sp. NPDC085596]|uniref:hypothetical protein n=1 Tax=Streptomyces sp. NPDC085596 TaxID=3365731 RepID=UPI0037D3AAAB
MQITLNPVCFEGVNQAAVEEGYVGIPHTITDGRLSLGAVGLLLRLISLNGEFDVDAAKREALARQEQNGELEDVDELLTELVDAGWISLPA